MSRAMTAAQQYADADMDAEGGMNEVELARLQRQFRLLEGERKTYSEESRTVIMRQTNAIKSLRKENGYLSEEIGLLKAQIMDDKKSGAGSKKSILMREQADLYQQRIKEITQEIHNVDRSLAELDRAIAKQRANLGGAQSTAEKQFAVQKQVTALENRLDKALVRFNKSLEGNSQLREQVDTLRRERHVFDNSYRKFERELVERKKQMAEIIEASTSAYEARDEAQARMVALKERAEKEYHSYLQEVKELDRQLEQDRKLKEFMTIKLAERADSQNQLRKQTNAQTTTKGSQAVLADSLDNYEQAFAKIQQVTNCDNIGELVKRFTQMEDQNFSLFNYVNELNNQTGAVEEETARAEQNIAAWTSSNSKTEQENKRVLKMLEDKLKSTTEATQLFEKEYESMTALLNDLDKGVERLIPMIAPTAQPAAGENALCQNLSFIEHKTNEMLMKNLLLSLPKKFTSAAAPNLQEKKDGAAPQDGAPADNKANQPLLETTKDPAALAAMLQSIIKTEGSEQTYHLENLLGQGPSAPITQFGVHAPVASDDVDSEEAGSEDDDRPMTRDELKIKMLKSIAKRERKIIANDLGSIGGGLSVVSSNALKSASTKARRNRKALA